MFRSGYKLDLLEPQSLMMLNGVPNDQKTSVKPQTERVVQGNSWKGRDVFVTLTMVMVTRMYTCVQNHQIVYMNCVQVLYTSIP